MNENHFRRLETMYHQAPCNAYYKARVQIEKGAATLTLPLATHLHHAAGAVHGVTYFKAMDDSAFFAANSLVDDVFVLTTSFTLYITRPVVEGTMRGIARVVDQTRTIIVAESVVYDDRDRQVARGTGTFMRSRIALSPDIGYGDRPGHTSTT